ncbi:MAG: hypothetical protein ACTS7I_02785, partial [Candidatus Hodgkinia cicadicola]
HLSNTLNSFRRQDSSSCVLASGTWQPPTSVECNSVRRSFATSLALKSSRKLSKLQHVKYLQTQV